MRAATEVGTENNSADAARRRRLLRAVMALAGLAVAGFPTAARANITNFVTNGNFSQNSISGGTGCGSTQTVTNSNLTDWSTTSGYTFIINSTNYSSFCGVDGGLGLFGPMAAPPDGNAQWMASDGAYLTGYIYQTLSGLTVGGTYAVSFYMAAAQQTGYSGATSDYWQIGLGSNYDVGPSVDTPTMNLPSQTFSGWMAQSVSLVAAATSEVLWFFAVGTPSGQPPFALLDGVVVSVQEPATSGGVLILGMLALAGVRRRVRRRIGVG